MSRVPPPLPVTLELAPLPRAQVGPYLILGVDKDADRETIEAAWAKRLIWARKGLTKSALEDINWAREMLSDNDRRAKADAASLNVDTTDGILRGFEDRFEGKQQATAGCKPIDIEKSLADYQPPTPIPDLEEVRRSIPPPEIPREVPAVRLIVEDFVRQPIDPWDIKLED